MPKPFQNVTVFLVFIYLFLHSPFYIDTAYGKNWRPVNAPSDDSESPFDVKEERDRPRNLYWPPLVSFVLPGFDQWYEQQTLYGAIYTGVSLGGYGLAESMRLTAEERRYANRNLDTRDNKKRAYILGNQLAQSMGGFSTYHSFRTAVRTRPEGDFSFLKYEESPAELALAPVRFDYLVRPTTFIPLAVFAGLSVALYQLPTPDEYRKNKITGADIGFSSAFSYNAGTHEEAFFRGYIYPMAMYHTNNPLIANAIQSTLFALAHMGNVEVPIAQLAMGFYLGYVSEKNDWTIAESIFIHTWWDVIAFVSGYAIQKKDKDKKNQMPPPTLWLPTLSLTF